MIAEIYPRRIKGKTVRTSQVVGERGGHAHNAGGAGPWTRAWRPPALPEFNVWLQEIAGLLGSAALDTEAGA